MNYTIYQKKNLIIKILLKQKVEFKNKQLLNSFINLFDNCEFNDKEEYIILPFSKVKSSDDIFKMSNIIVQK